MQTDLSRAAVIVAWVTCIVAAYVLGVYTTYRHELNSGISEAQYRTQSLQILSEIRDSNNMILDATVDLYSDF